MLRVLEYGGERSPAFRDIDLRALAGTIGAAREAPLLWIDAADPDQDELEALADGFDWHPLVREDVETGDQRQKVEQYPGAVFAVLYLPRLDGMAAQFVEVFAVLTEHCLVTVHHGCSAVIDRVGAHAGVRPDLAKNGAMAAMTALLDHVASSYEVLLDGVEETIEDQEADALEPVGDPVPMLRRGADLRRAIVQLRRQASSLRESLGVLVRRELVDVSHSTELDLELRDVYDHVLRAHEDLDVLSDRMTALAETRLSMGAYRQNEITKKLSAWGAILIVPAIVTGWYGQNFHHLGSLSWAYGPEFSLLVMLVICGAFWVAFHRAGWL